MPPMPAVPEETMIQLRTEHHVFIVCPKEILKAKLLKRRSLSLAQPLLCCPCDTFTSVLCMLMQHLSTHGAP